MSLDMSTSGHWLSPWNYLLPNALLGSGCKVDHELTE